MLATPNFKSSTMVIALLQHNDNESNGQHWWIIIVIYAQPLVQHVGDNDFNDLQTQLNFVMLLHKVNSDCKLWTCSILSSP
jgi:hypothetical protein